MKTQHFFLFLLLVGTVSACTEDHSQTIEEPQTDLVLKLDAGTSEFESDDVISAASDSETRAGYNGTHSIWHSGDEIGLSFDAVNTNLPFTQISGTLSADSRRVSYSGSLNTPLTGTVNAVAYYPYSSTATVSGKILTTTFPATQIYNAAGGYRGIPLFSTFTGDYNNIKLAFKNPYSFIKLNLAKGVALTNTIKLQKIIFKGNNNETVSGPMTVNMSSATPVVTLTGSGKDITLDMTASNVELTQTAKSFYIAVPAINYSKGYSFTIVTDNGQVTKSAKNTGTTYVANKIYTTPTLTINNLSLVSIPDANLRAALQALGLISIFDNLLGTVTITSAGMAAQSIDISGKNIANLTGIDKFPALLTLKAGNNNLTSVDLSKLTLLTNLDLSKNQLTALNLAANTALLSLDVSSNLLTDLDLHNNILLTSVKCFGNAINTLNISGLVALLNLNLDSTNNSAINLLRFTVPVGATVKNLIANNASSAVNWTAFDCTGNATIESISLQNNLLLTAVTARSNPQLLSLNIKGCLVTLIPVTSGNKAGFTVSGPL